MSAPITTRVVRNARRRGLRVIYRSGWGSTQAALYADRQRRTAQGSWGRFILRADTLVQHITVTPRGTTLREFKAAMRTLERIGMDRFGSGVSYNFVVDPVEGWVGVGQPLDSKGTHTVNDKGVAGFSHDQNLAARAVAILGNPGVKLTAKGVNALAQLQAAMVDEGALTVTYDYVPHSLFAYKDCPCDDARAHMPSIRQRVGDLLREGRK